MSYSYVIGREVEEWAIGERWRFGKFTRLVWADLALEARRLLPDPVVAALDAIEAATLKDAEILRKLIAADEVEAEKAKAENRQPVLMATRYSSIADGLQDRAYQAKTRYLSAGSPELNGFLFSNEGQAYLFYLLLRRNHPAITDEQAYDVYRDLSENNGKDGRKTPDEIIRICNGRAAELPKNEAPPASNS